MPSFRDILTATDAGLVKHFYRVGESSESDFIRKINQAARQLELNHTQLVCALGFNHHIRELTDILSVVGFSSYKLLRYRRDELFTNDIYRHLDIENVVDIYAEHIKDEEVTAAIGELLLPRLGKIEAQLGDGADPAQTISYKMEMHSIYAGGLASAEFVAARLQAPIGDLRVMIDEIGMIVEQGLVPPSNLFFSDDLLPAEKASLINGGAIDQKMIANRLSNNEISEDERQLLEDFLD